MGLDLFGLKSKAALAALQNQVSQLIQSQQRFGSFTVYPSYDKVDNAERYCTTDDVYSIIKLIAGTAATIPIYTYIEDKNGDEVEPPDNDPLKKLIDMPFDGMTQHESIYLLCATILMQGEAIAWKEIPELGPNKGKVTRLHYMPPQDMIMKVSEGFPRKIVSWSYAPNGNVVMDNIPPEEIIHWKYPSFKSTFTGTELRGLSPLVVLAKRLARVDSNMDVTTAQLQNGTVPTIVYEKTPGATVETAAKRRDNYLKFISNTSNAGGAYFAADELGMLQLGLKAADMEVAQLAKLDFKKLCNAYGVSDRLFNNDATGSEVSDKGARQGLYSNAAMPLLKMITDGFEHSLAVNFKPVKYCIEADFSEVSELQVNYGEMVAWLEKAWWLTPNEKREIMLFEKSTEPLFEQYLLPSGLQTVEDLTMIPEIIPPTGDFNANP